VRIFSRVCLLLLVVASPAGASAVPREPLVPGAAVERTPAAGDVQTFELAVRAGTAVALDIDQRGADVSTTLTPAQGDQVSADDTDRGAIGRERLLWMPAADGTVTLTVKTARVNGPGARYVLRADVIEATDGLDVAVRAFNTPSRLLGVTPVPPPPGIEGDLGAALALWRRLGERALAAETQMRLAKLQLNRLQRPVDAIASYTDALAAFEALGFQVDVVNALSSLAEAQRQLGRYRESIDSLERARASSEAIDPFTAAILESDLSRAMAELGDYEGSIPYAMRAIAAFKRANAFGDAIVTQERLADSYIGLRRVDEALEVLSEALTLAPKYGKPNSMMSLWRTVGRVHSAAGDDERAIAAFRKAQEIVPPDSMPGQVLVLDIARQQSRRAAFAEERAALEPLLARIPPQQQNTWAAVATELGWAYTSLGEPARALPLQTKALEIVKAGGSARSEVIVLRDLANTQRALADLAGARASTGRIAELAAAMPGNPLGSLLLREKARNERLAGDLPAAQKYMDLAIADIEAARDSQRAQALRASFAGNTISYYEDAIDLAMEMHAKDPQGGHDGRALALFERSRARSLSDLLANASVDIRADVAPALIAQQKDLQRQIAIADAGIRAAGKDHARVDTLEQEIDQLTRQLTVLDAQARAASPRYHAATRPALGSLAEIQALLDDDTVLLAFASGTKKGWGWAVTRTSVRAFETPAAAAIDAAARAVVEAMRQPASSASADEARAALSDLVLGPIAAPLAGEWRGRRLAIVASGPLEYVPFAALAAPAAPGAAPAARGWLGRDHEIVLLPSASVLALLREPRPRRTAPAGGLVVIADPVYSASDPRVASRGSAPVLMARATTRRAGGEAAPATPPAAAPDGDGSVGALTRAGSTHGDFARLVFSRQEARALAELAGPHRAVQELDFDANLATVRGPVAAGARFLHLATHGILDATRPERSGLVLSLVDRNGQARDGVLRLNDIFSLSLSADLVVLSGCETGLGRQLRGEGLVGLTRAFMYAGAPRVVSSLWQVDDQATAQLMTRFYRHLLQGGERPAAALRAAQLELSADPRWAAPYFWAGFVMQGDWR